jgi:Tfp pilus assembly protein PilW
MISLLIAVLSVGVIVRVFVDSWPASTTQQPQEQFDEERAQMMALIAQSFF